jgi:hypothetical protein
MGALSRLDSVTRRTWSVPWDMQPSSQWRVVYLSPVDNSHEPV